MSVYKWHPSILGWINPRKYINLFFAAILPTVDSTSACNVINGFIETP